LKSSKKIYNSKPTKIQTFALAPPEFYILFQFYCHKKYIYSHSKYIIKNSAHVTYKCEKVGVARAKKYKKKLFVLLLDVKAHAFFIIFSIMRDENKRRILVLYCYALVKG